MTDSSSSAGSAPVETPPLPPTQKRKFKLGPEQKSFLDKLTKREAAWLLYAIICLVTNYFLPIRFDFSNITIWTVVQAGLTWMGLTWLSVWILWTQINTIEITTRDDAPIVDSQGSDDMGWTYYAYVAFGLMYVTTALGFILSIVAPDRVPAGLIKHMYISWTMLAYTPIMWLISRIDLELLAAIFQRNNRLRTRLTRFEETAH